MVPAFKRLPTEDETLAAIELIERAIAEKRVVRVQFFKERRNRRGLTQRFDDSFNNVFGQPKMLETVPVWRTVEPQDWDTNKDGQPYARVISHTPSDSDVPQARVIRLDRVAVAHDGLRIRITDQPFKVTGTGYDPAWYSG